MLLRRITHHIREYEWFAIAVEIMVIIIGLMLALQLDRWQESRAERGQERTYIDRLISNVQADIPAIEFAIELQSMRLEFVDLLIAVADKPEKSMVEPTIFLGAVKQAAYTYTPSLTSHTFENLRSTGDLSLILDQAVKDELFEYYGFDQEQRQYRPLQFMTESRHFELAAGVLSVEHELYVQDFWLFFRPDNVVEARNDQPPTPEAVMSAALRLRDRPELVAWLPYVRDMQLEQIAVHKMRLERARKSLNTLQEYAQRLNEE